MLRDFDRASTRLRLLHGGEHWHLETVARLWCLDRLPTVRTLMLGPKWKRYFSVEQRPLSEIRPPWYALIRHGRRWVLCFTLEEDVRERVTSGGWSHERYDELRPGVFAMWAD